jgi:putative transposase
VKGQWT